MAVFTAGGVGLVQKIHMAPDDGDDRYVLVDEDVRDVFDGYFAVELGGEHLPGQFGYRSVHDEAYPAFRGGLGNDLDADPAAGQGGEDPGVDADFAQHAASFDAHQCYVVYHGDGFQPFPGAVLGNGSTLAVGMEGVEDADGDLFLDKGKNGLGMEYVRAEIGQLVGLAVREQGNDLRILHHGGVGRIYAIHVGPVLYLFGAQEAGSQGAE